MCSMLNHDLRCGGCLLQQQELADPTESILELLAFG